MNIFISQPMRGLSEDQIMEVRQEVIDEFLKIKMTPADTPFYFMNNYDHPNLAADANPLLYLGEDIEMMADADMIIFVEGWDRARGCIIEHKICHYYDLKYIYAVKKDDGNWGFRTDEQN